MESQVPLKQEGRGQCTTFKIMPQQDFPGGPVVKNPPYNSGDAGLIPGQGNKIPRAAGQLSPSAATTELAHLN